MSFVIAIDGPAAAGKGTLARALAAHLDFAYLDTGTLYRAVGLKAAHLGLLDAAGPVAEGLAAQDLNHPQLRSLAAGEFASQVAAQSNVRAALFAFQRKYGLQPPDGKAGAILDGRDIGTVIFPQASLKLFITASAEIRAHRRLTEQRVKPGGNTITMEDMLAQVRTRDARDSNRKDAPLQAAKDAHVIDTSYLNAKQVLQAALDLALPLIKESA